MNNIQIDPKSVYPTEGLNSISEDKIQFFMKYYTENGVIPPIKIFEYQNDYYVIDGHHRVLAATRMQLPLIDAINVLIDNEASWMSPNYFELTLTTLGLSSLYDFEGVGGFTFTKYPESYKQ